MDKDQFGRMRYQHMEVDIDSEEHADENQAQETNGKYYRADSAETLRHIYEEIDRLEKSEVEVNKYQHYDELFGKLWP